MSEADRQRWDEKWEERAGGAAAPHWLVGHGPLLGGGIAVDLATGRGAAARWLSAHGYRVVAIDVSRVALRQAKTGEGSPGTTDPLFVEADLDELRLPPSCADLITVFWFLDRTLFPMIRQAVRPGGLLIYQTRTIGWQEREPSASVEFLLRRGELLQRFGDWQLLSYLENTAHAALVACRPHGH